MTTHRPEDAAAAGPDATAQQRRPGRLRQALDAIDERMGIKALAYPVPEHANNLSWSLGGLTAVSFVTLLVTGVYMAQFYSPTPEDADQSVRDLVTTVWQGGFRPRSALLGRAGDVRLRPAPPAAGVLPRDVPTALRIGRGTLRKMRQNLGWAIGYNALALPIAAGVFEPAFGLVLRPEIAAPSMSGSSFIVAVNALSLKGLRLPSAAPSPTPVPREPAALDSGEPARRAA
ncbi:hypothetical protein ABZ608_14035 [Streptomyces sp. NPDC013172]|uniref:hypothetical protein n=1 Tax=Streptomyces sp. NPDC013172 TaxID=3155009 RepID=UPI00340D5AB3